METQIQRFQTLIFSMGDCMSIVALDRVQWEWLKRYYINMLTAIEKTQIDGRERGFLIVQNNMRVARTRTQVGTASRVILKMKKLPITSNDILMSFHTHNGGLDRPSARDRKTAVALGEEYTVIGYFDKGKPFKLHIKVWSVYQRWNYKIRTKCIFTF